MAQEKEEEEYKEVYEEDKLSEEEREKIRIISLMLLDMNNRENLEKGLQVIAEREKYQLLLNFEKYTERQFINKLTDYALQYINKNMLEKIFNSMNDMEYKIFETLVENSNNITISKEGYITYEIHFYKKYENNNIDIAEMKINYSELSNKISIQIIIGDIDFNSEITEFYSKVIEHIIKVLNDP